MIKLTCCFTGSRPECLSTWPDGEEQNTLSDMLRGEIKRVITEEKVTHFITGMTPGSDLICAGLILELRKKYPQISLECAVPYEEQAVRWAVELREIYYNILDGCDKLTQLQTSYTRDCLKKHTQYVIGKSGHVLAVWDGTWRGKTGQMLLLAKKQKRAVITIDTQTFQVTRTKETETGQG